MRRFIVSLLFVMVFAGTVWASAVDSGAARQNDTPPGPTAATASADVGVGTGEGPVDSEYPVGPGDVLSISVWKDEALTKDVVVLPDGVISFPLIGLFKVSGKTVAQIKGEIEKKIVLYVPEPVLNVEVKQVNSLMVYVIGRVNSAASGRYILNARTNVLQALAIAGGLNPFAKRNSIKIFRQEGGRTTILHFRYDDVVDGKHLEDNVELKRGDVVVVP